MGYVNVGCAICPLPVLPGQRRQSVSQPLLKQSMLGNSSLEFPWIHSRPPLTSLLPLSHSPLLLLLHNPPASSFPPWLFHLVDTCVCVSKSLLLKSRFFFVPIWARHLLWWVSYLSNTLGEFSNEPLQTHFCQRTSVSSVCCLSMSACLLWLIFTFSPLWKMTNKDSIQLELCLFVALAEAFQDAIIIAIVITG